MNTALHRVLRCALILMTLGGSGAAGAAPPDPVRVADGVYAALGDNGEPAPDNDGRVANQGFIIGSERVLAIDTGTSDAAGRSMLAAIEARVAKPIEAAVLTHAAPEFIFGATAFQRRGIAVLAHRDAAQLMRQRCERCLEKLRMVLGEPAMRDSAVPVPERLIEGSTVIDLGDREVELVAVGWASSPGELAVFDRRTRTLFAAGLVTAARVPNLRDGRIDAWIDALVALRQRPLRHVVPGFGPVGGPQLIDRQLAYLRALRRAVQQRYAAGSSLIETMQSAALPAFRHWQGYELRHAQNVLYVYRQLEDADFRTPSPAAPHSGG